MKTTAFIAIVGCPNVGKSSILNALLGEKVAIVSEKPQTTRTRIMGVLTEGERQLVFTDTPGLHRPRTRLGEHMARAVREGMDGVDACLLAAEATGKGLRPQEELLMQDFAKRRAPAILALNKVDLLRRKEELMERILLFSRAYDFAAVVPCSVKTGENMDALRGELAALCGSLELAGGFYFPEDTLTDQPERALAAELLREQLLRHLEEEIPHGTAVVIEKFHTRADKPDMLDIEATIFCERESHKGMVIGKGGAMLKKIASAARAELEGFFGCRVNLQCWVKVKEGWRNREGVIRNFGLE
ncbi:MAG: GTPase Era [Oscillospiraceae bacterium]|jgi:GTP-binding protein Era|nr:GTPase Era [Oscillospiraceae bacterium]